MKQKYLLAAVLLAAAGVSPVGAVLAAPIQQLPTEGAVVRAVPITGTGPQGQAERPLGGASAAEGRIGGVVVDVDGHPLAGAAVTVFGPLFDFAVTDQHGRYAFDRLPAGSYTVQAHLAGFEVSGRSRLEVRDGRSMGHEIRLQPVPAARVQRPVLTASVGAQPEAAPSDRPALPNGQEDESHTATAWRLRHLKRSVLRDDTDRAGLEDQSVRPHETGASTLSFLDSASAQVQLLTISAFDRPDEIFSGAHVPYGVAYLALTAPLGTGTWAVQGALTQGDVSSWVVGGRYTQQVAARHATEVGMSYAAQRYDGGNPAALVAIGETNRTVGAMYASDRWTMSRHMLVSARARFERNGYIEGNGLLSPSIEWRWEPIDGQALRALVTQQTLAPGADEFVPSSVAGLWMPPQRTFSSLQSSDEFRPERTRHLEVGYEQNVARVIVSARGFRQRVSDQIVTVFGLQPDHLPRADLGHYFTASAGSVDAYGWGVSVTSPASTRWRGSLAYTQSHAHWLDEGKTPAYWVLARTSGRPSSERIQDLTTSVETDIRETATRVLAVYKLNSSFASDTLSDAPMGGRFELQVNQRLPVPAGDAQWEVLVAVKNLFRDETEGSSVYDELLVVRPPKRIVGGLLVRF